MIQLQALYDTAASFMYDTAARLYDTAASAIMQNFFLPTSGSGATVSDVSAIYDNLLAFARKEHISQLYLHNFFRHKQHLMLAVVERKNIFLHCVTLSEIKISQYFNIV